MSLQYQGLSLLAQSLLLQALCKMYRDVQIFSGYDSSNRDMVVFREMIRGEAQNILQLYQHQEDNVAKAQAIISIMDSYEILAIENDLQVVLSYSEKLLPHLEDLPLKCKLLSYCYYYVEEPECAEEATRIVKSWNETDYSAEMVDAKRCYEMLI